MHMNKFLYIIFIYKVTLYTLDTTKLTVSYYEYFSHLGFMIFKEIKLHTLYCLCMNKSLIVCIKF